MARSRVIKGPYELHPDTYILTARHRPDAELQRAGHADLVETQRGETYMVHLCGRPLRNRGRCTLGRETAIQRMKWCEDDWLRTADTGGVPQTEVAAPDLPEHAFPRVAVRTVFEGPQFPSEFQWLRTPWPSDLFRLTARPRRLRMYGLDSPGSVFRQSLGGATPGRPLLPSRHRCGV
jgi:xylan 1,4-beta-xylosidase